MKDERLVIIIYVWYGFVKRFKTILDLIISTDNTSKYTQFSVNDYSIVTY